MYRPMHKTSCWVCAVVLLACAGMGGMIPAAVAQPTFSIDSQGPTIGMPDSWSGLAITEGDILSSALPGPPLGRPALGPLPVPGIVIPAGPPMLLPSLGLATYPHPVEVDALSFGHDKPCGYWHFSVDEFANGLPGTPPDVFSEGASGNMEASADMFVCLSVIVHPTVLPPPPGAGAVIPANLDVIDGNGLPPFGGKGVGLIEPNPPTPGQVPDPGDNVDALDMDTKPQHLVGPIYFSLDSRFVDPIEGRPPNLGSAAANGFVGGDVLVTSLAGAPVVYASAGMLGLDFLGPDTDDVDALVVWDDGDGEYEPGEDFLAFSVRRGSLVVGAPDSIWGMPIEEADILVPPGPGAISPFPGILVPGEALGLVTFRSGPVPPPGPDDLDALDVARLPGDCDGNGVVDVFDAILLVNAFGSKPGDPHWDPRADLNCSNTVDIFDVITLVNNFGTTW